MDNYVVRDWMTTSPATITPKTSLSDAHRLMKQKKVRRLPVVEDGILVGQVSRRDVLRVWTEAIEQAPGRNAKTRLLYWSALFERQEAPLA